MIHKSFLALYCARKNWILITTNHLKKDQVTQGTREGWRAKQLIHAIFLIQVTHYVVDTSSEVLEMTLRNFCADRSSWNSDTVTRFGEAQKSQN